VTLLSVALQVDEEQLNYALNEVNDWTNKDHVEPREVLSTLVIMQAGMHTPVTDID
jgi:hypothetical protein